MFAEPIASAFPIVGLTVYGMMGSTMLVWYLSRLSRHRRSVLRRGFNRLARIAVVILAAGAASTAFSQTGSIEGAVLDQASREPLPSANVQIPGTALGASSGADGRFTITGIPVGNYQLRISLVGYEPVVLSDIVVMTGRQQVLEIGLDQVPVDVAGVEVTASFFQKSPDAPVSVQRLSAEEIRRSPGGWRTSCGRYRYCPGWRRSMPGGTIWWCAAARRRRTSMSWTAWKSRTSITSAHRVPEEDRSASSTWTSCGRPHFRPADSACGTATGCRRC